MARDARRVGAVLALLTPALLAAAGPRLAAALPESGVGWQGLIAALGGSPPWWGVVGVLVGLGVALRPGWRAAGLLTAALHLPVVGRPGPWGAAPAPGDLRVVVANVNAYADRETDRALVAALTVGAPEVIALVEERPPSLPGYTVVDATFGRGLPRPSHGTALFCRAGVPCAGAVTSPFGHPSLRMPLGLLRLPGLDACLLVVHAPPPAPLEWRGTRPWLEALAARVADGRLREAEGGCAAGDAVVLAGDFNATPGSPVMRVLGGRGLRDPQHRAGLFALSWPAGGSFIAFPMLRLDQLRHGNGLRVGAVETFALPGSDHRGLRFTVGAAAHGEPAQPRR